MRVAWLSGVLALIQVGGGCAGKDRSPQGAVELFLRAIQEGDSAEVYRLLAPSSQRELEQRAQLAKAQAAGRAVKPQELLAVGRDPYRYGEISQIRSLGVEGDRARVEIADARRPGAPRETLALERVEGRWRVVLPRPAPVEAPASAPATRPASQPAASRPGAE
jgi:hypothetical protein